MPLPDLPQTEIAIVELTNAFRAGQKLGAVTVNAKLTTAARAYAKYLADSGKFAHEADGRQPWDRTKAAGYSHCVVAENLASHLDSRGFETRALATAAMEGWKNSPGHRANLVLPAVTEIGVGVVQASGPHPKFLSVQLFGRPDSFKFSFKVDNRSAASVSYTVGGRDFSVEAHARITHTTCAPDEIAFKRAGNFFSGKSLAGRFTASDGAVYTLKSDAQGAVTVDAAAGKRR